MNKVNVHEKVASLMVKIPSGQVMMRDDRIRKKWKVNIEPFYLSKYLVTQDLYYIVMNSNPSENKGDLLPVESLTWLDAVRFCNKLSELADLIPYYQIDEQTGVFTTKNTNGFRLPTEAEWQYACQCGTNNIRYGELDYIAWYDENAENSSHEVGMKEPNEWGLYDMLGNVWEWCSDIYDEEVYGTYRVLRGGGWSDNSRSVMATTRRRSHPISFMIDDLGFRIARNL